MNAIAPVARPSLMSRLAGWITGRSGVATVPLSVPMRAPVGDAGLLWVSAGRGKRPQPEGGTPDQHSPAGWVTACNRAANDPKIASALDIRAATLINADVRAVPGRDTSPEMAEAVALVNRVFGWDDTGPGYLHRGWSQVFGELMVRADAFGASLGEEVWDVVDGARVVVDIEQRHLANLESWDRDDRGRVYGVHLRRSGPRRSKYDMPLYWAADEAGGGVHFAFGFDGDPEGRGGAALGSTIDWVDLKAHMTKQAWDGVSRWAMPVVKAKLMTEVAQRMGMSLDDPTIAELVGRAADAAVAFMSGDEAALSASDIIDLEAFGGTLDLAQWVELSNAVDHQVLTALGLSSLTYGVSATNGSHSAADAIGDMFLRVLAARLTLWLAQFRRQTVARLVRFNLGPDAPVPLLVHEGIDVDGLGLNIGALPHLVAARLVDPDDHDDRRAVRRTLGLRTRAMPIAPQVDAAPIGDPGAPGPGRGNGADPNMTPMVPR